MNQITQKKQSEPHFKIEGTETRTIENLVGFLKKQNQKDKIKNVVVQWDWD